MADEYSFANLRAKIRKRIDDARASLDHGDPTGAADEAQLARSGCKGGMDRLIHACEARDDRKLRASEQRDFDALRELSEEARAIENEGNAQCRAQIDGMRADVEESRAAALRSAEKYGGTKVTSVRVGSEPGIYHERGEHSFFGDMAAMRYMQDPLAAERLAGHARGTQLETRDAAASAFAGLVIPQYLVDHFAPVARQGRPFADFIGSQPLPPDGMTLNVPRGATGTLVVSQTSENSAVGEQDMANVDIVVPVVTIAGQHDMSRQSMDRGRNTDREVMSDLAEAYSAEIDRQIIAGPGTSNQHLGLLSTTNVTTITVTSTGGITQVRQIAGGVSRVHSSRYMPAQVIVVHPRRWAYWTQATDSQGRPIVTPNQNGPMNAFGVGDLTNANGIVGELYGLPVLADPNIPTTLSFDVTQSSTTDPIIVTRASDLRLFEDDPLPRRVRFEETLAGSLTVKIVGFDYSAFTAGRYATATVVLAGSGLTTPVFGS